MGENSKAASLFEEIATKSLENNLLKFSAKEYFLRSGLCYMAMDDLITSQKAIERFEVADPGFSQSRECKLLKVRKNRT
jgi:alpha-soluble NSF attachment protein